MEKELILGYFGDFWYHSAGGDHKKFDLNMLIVFLKEYGLNAVPLRIDEIKDTECRPIFYTSSENPEIRGWIVDHISILRDKLLYPEYDLLLAHENKGYQALLAKKRDLLQPKTKYVHDIDDYEYSDIVVGKSIHGAGSKGVKLIDSKRKLLHYRIKPTINRWLRIIRKKIILKDGYFENYYYKHKGHKRMVIQEFMSGLDYDYKVLIFFDRLYCLKRFTKPNDFRASGSGLFCEEKPDYGLLNFAYKVSKKFRAPCMSLDIVAANKAYHLIEYQALNFGPLTLRLVDRCYEYKDGAWIVVKADPLIERNYAYAIWREMQCLV